MITADQLTEQDINFLKALKGQGVDKNEAFERLAKVKASLPQASKAPGFVKTATSALSKGLDMIPGIGTAKKAVETGLGVIDKVIGNENETFNVADVATETVKGVTQIPKAIGEGIEQAQESTARRSEVMNPIAEQKGALGETAMNVGTGVLNTLDYASKIIGGAISPLANPTIKATVENLSPEAQDTLNNSIQSITTKFESLTPEQQEAIRGTGLLAEALLGGITAPTVGRVGKEVVESTIEAIPGAMNLAGDVATGLAKAPKAIAKGTADGAVSLATKIADPENVLQNLNRITKKQVNDFAKLNQGKTPAEWLIERDIIDTPPKTVEILTERAKQAQKTLDDSLAQVDATYKPVELQEPIIELKETFQTTKPYGGADVDVVNRLSTKLENEGLTLSEVNQLKRIYERNVRVNYLRENNPKSIARANEIDSFMRNFVRNEAEKAGVPDVKRLSNEIQSSYSIADNIVSTFEGRKANNPFSINDFILMGGAISDLTSGGALLAGKKIFESPRLRAAFVRAATKGDVKAMKELPGVPNEIINIKNAERRSLELQKWASENGIYAMLGKETPKALPAPTDILAPKPSPDVMAEVYRQGEMVSEPLSDVDRAKLPSDFNKAGAAESANPQKFKDLAIKAQTPDNSLTNYSVEELSKFTLKTIDDKAGYALKPIDDKGRMELVNVFVIPEAQGQGLAKQVMFDAIQTAKKSGAKTLYLDAYKRLEGLYSKFRFKTIEELPFDPKIAGFPEGEDLVIMELNLR